MATNEFFVNVEAAIYKDDQWLMIIRSDSEAHAAGTLSMVGGTVEFVDQDNDTLEEALRREVSEEVGVTLDDKLSYVESKKFVTDLGEYVMDIVFMAAHKSGVPTAINSEEVADLAWMTKKQIDEHPKTPAWIRQSIEKAESLRVSLVNS